MPYRNYLIASAILLLALALGYWSYDGSIVSVGERDASVIRENADYFLVGAEIREFNEQGELGYTLKSDSITHYPHNDHTLLQKPVMASFEEKAEVFKSVSQSGKLLPGGDDIELWDDVVMTQTELGTGKTVRMDTDFITIYSEKEMADTNSPVYIVNDHGDTRAIGMTAWYQQGLIKLKSRVRGTYEPE